MPTEVGTFRRGYIFAGKKPPQKEAALPEEARLWRSMNRPEGAIYFETTMT